MVTNIKLGRSQGLTTQVVSVLFLGFFFIAPKAFASDATLLLSPTTGEFYVNAPISVRVLLDSDGAKINGTESVLNFDPKAVEVTSVSREESILTSWPEEPSFNNEKGEIRFSGALSTSTIVSGGKILSITLTPLRAGTFGLEFSSGAATQILPADGTGGNIVSSLKNAKFTAIPKDNSGELEEESAGEVLGAATGTSIFSSTHPTQTEWYNTGTATLSWILPEGVIATKLSVDQKQNSVGKIYYAPPITSKTLYRLPDGVSYFHLTKIYDDGSENTSHFILNVDTVAPADFAVVELERTDPSDPATTYQVTATDTLSGIDHYEFAVDAGNPVVWQDTGDHKFRVENVEAGAHELTASAVDRAGNRMTVKRSFLADPIPVPRIGLAQSEPKEGDPLTLGVESLPDGTVEISISRDKNSPVVEEFTVDGTGKGTFTSAFVLQVGEYKAWAVFRNAHGIRSKQSEWVTVQVGWTIMGVLKRHPAIMISAGVILSLLFLTIFFWKRARRREMGDVHMDYETEENRTQKKIEHTTQRKPVSRVVLEGKDPRSVFEPTRL